MKPAEASAFVCWAMGVCVYTCVCVPIVPLCTRDLEVGCLSPLLHHKGSSPRDMHGGFSLITSAGVLSCTNVPVASVCPVCLLIPAHLFSQNETPGHRLMTTALLPQISAQPSPKTSKGILFGSPYRAPQPLPLISSSQIQRALSLPNPSR